VINGTVSAWHARAARELAWPGQGRKFIAGMVGLGGGVLLWVVGQHPALILAGAIGTGVLYFKIAALVGVPSWARRNMMGVAAEGELPASFTWTEHALSWTNQHNLSGSRPWTEYVWMAENEDVLLLFVTLDGYQVLPKPWFRDQQQLDEFRALAATCLVGARDPALQSRDYLAEWLPIVAIMGGSVLFAFLLYLAMS
jgi:hypothetical protein